MQKKKILASKTTKKENELGYKYLIFAFSEASRITVSLVLFPIVFLLIGIWMDKRFYTKPLFIVLGVLVGVIVAIYKSIKVGENLKKKYKTL